MDTGVDGAGDERLVESASFTEPKVKGSQHKRIVSVDMIKDEHDEMDVIKHEPDDALGRPLNRHHPFHFEIESDLKKI